MGLSERRLRLSRICLMGNDMKEQENTTPRRRRKDSALQNLGAGTLAIVPAATGDTPNAVESLAAEPTHEAIARRAYQLYEDRGRKDGHDTDNWFQAERELRDVALNATRDRIGATENPYAAA